MLMTRVFYTDGSASPNPGPGGYAVVEGDKPVALGSESGDTTNIRMEGSALIAAMQLADSEPCEIFTDSEFWINVITKWAPGWAAKGWRKSGGPIKNLELVQEATSCTIPRAMSPLRGFVAMLGTKAMSVPMSGQIKPVKAHGYDRAASIG